MAIKIGINGIGRIGRMVLRIACENPEKFQVVGINDPFVSAEYMLYLLKYDTTHGTFNKKIEIKNNLLYIDNNYINIFGEKNPEDIPWGTVGADYIVESTGVFCTTE